MAQRRMIAKSISTSKKANRVSDKAALLFTWIIPHCDDFGHMDGSPDAVKAIVVPMRSWRLSDVSKCIEELEKEGLIELYDSDGEKYLEIVKFDEFQTFKNDRERLSLFPDKSINNKCNPVDSKSIHEDSYKLSEVKLKEVNQSEVKALPPKDESNNFFIMVEENGIKYESYIKDYVEKFGVDPGFIKLEIKKFCNHWLERNRSGTKQKWELEPTFEVQRRLATWFRNAQKWSNERTVKRGKQIV